MFNTLDNCVPKKLDMIAGGASFAPRRWALVALEMLAFSNALWVYTAFSTLTTKVTKRRLSSGVLPGPSKDSGIGSQRPVIVLAGTVHAFERFLVQQDTEPMFAGDLAH